MISVVFSKWSGVKLFLLVNVLSMFFGRLDGMNLWWIEKSVVVRMIKLVSMGLDGRFKMWVGVVCIGGWFEMLLCCCDFWCVYWWLKVRLMI